MNKKEFIGEIIEAKFPLNNIILETREDGSTRKYKVKGGILGQKVRAKKSNKKKSKIFEIVEKSQLEDIEGCKHKDCGGCIYDTMSYENEIKYKEELLKSLFKENGYDFNFELIKNIHFTKYRNKMEYTFGDEYKGSEIALGLHKKNKFYEIVNTDECGIVHKDFNIIRENVREFFKGEEFYNRFKHTGILRHLVIRRTNFGEILINLVTTSGYKILKLDEFVKMLLDLNLEAKIVGITHSINDSYADVVRADEFKILYGRDYAIEVLHGLKFKIYAFSFFQTNSYSAEMLYQMAFDMIEDLNGKRVLDLYCGTGTITQIFAKVAKFATGIEIVEDAVKSARENAKINNISNTEFICGDVLEEIKKIYIKPDIIVLDPPRDGVHVKAIDKILDFNPEEFIYISCNPITFVRDLEKFYERGYEVKKIKGLDQFPRTQHLEIISLISK